MSSPPEKMEPEVEEPLNGTTSSSGNKRVSFATKFKAISVEKPPSKEPINFLIGVFGLCCVCLPATACLTCCCFLGLLYQFIPIAEIIIGAYYYDKEYCEKEDIALILIIGGSIGMLHGLVECCGGGRQIQQQGKESTAENGGAAASPQEPKQAPLICRFLSSIMRIAAFVWFIYAAVVVFRFYGSVSYDEGDVDYCHPLLYRFLFWVVVISLVFLACTPIILCCACCLGLGAAAAASAVE